MLDRVRGKGDFHTVFIQCPEIFFFYVELFKDNGRYKDDVLVCVNGESCQIKRGVRVRIKRKFLWAIQNQMRQDANTANMIQEMHEAFDDAARANGVKL